MINRVMVVLAATVVVSRPVQAQSPLPALPDSAGWGVHVLAIARAPGGAVWVGTYGQGMFRLDPGSDTWINIRQDTSETSISWDFIHAIAFGPRGQVWYGTIGNGWGVSLDGGATWRNWTYDDLGPEWQYVAPSGVVTRGDTTWVGTADGIQVTTDDGRRWTALVDSTGPASAGPADTALVVLGNEYVRRIATNRRGLVVSTMGGRYRYQITPTGEWTSQTLTFAPFPPLAGLVMNGYLVSGTQCGFRMVRDTLPCMSGQMDVSRTMEPARDSLPLRTTWFRRPIALDHNPFIDQTYRYGSTMGGNFQEHQGVEFNNPDGTAVRAIGAGTVVYAGPAERGALTVAIRHDSVVVANGERYRIYSTYYHNSELQVSEGQRVSRGQTIAAVGNTGRATNDHLHLEIHAAPTDSVNAIVDSLERFPAYTTNPELWIDPIPGTGVIAGQVLDGDGQPVPQARIYGIVKHDPPETPFSFAETYGDLTNPHPLYRENFAVSDVPAGHYILGTEIYGQRVYREVTVYEGMLSWVVFRP
ncbi:MAG: M23 family metallopeptidase [Gemmatimonadetes bacterium]|nr:M23 family metallopeptidase [Gemmatimonadota bacterium]